MLFVCLYDNARRNYVCVLCMCALEIKGEGGKFLEKGREVVILYFKEKYSFQKLLFK